MIKELKNKIQFAAIAAPIYAAQTINIKPVSGSGFDNLLNIKAENMLSGSITLLFIVVSLIFFFILVLGGLKWITSGGDEKKVAAARAGITNALIGLVVVFAAWAIVNLISYFFGITILGNITLPTF